MSLCYLLTVPADTYEKDFYPETGVLYTKK